MAGRRSEKLPVGMLVLVPVLAVAGYLLFDLQRWAGTPGWEAAAMGIAMSGAVYIGAAALVGGARGLGRRVAIAMIVIPGVFVLAGVAGPLVQAVELTQVKLPLRVALGGMPPLLLIGTLMLGVRLHHRRSSR